MDLPDCASGEAMNTLRDISEGYRCCLYWRDGPPPAPGGGCAYLNLDGPAPPADGPRGARWQPPRLAVARGYPGRDPPQRKGSGWSGERALPHTFCTRLREARDGAGGNPGAPRSTWTAKPSLSDGCTPANRPEPTKPPLALADPGRPPCATPARPLAHPARHQLFLWVVRTYGPVVFDDSRVDSMVHLS